MSQELYYTSAPTGLKPGSKGFCTVAMTAGMSATVVQRLELLSGYQELYSPGDLSAENNPVAWSHWRLSVDGRTQSVLSRVCSAGMDYTQRANVFAHHVVLDGAEQAAGGPAWLISQPGVMETHWQGSPRVLPNPRPVPKGEETTRICSNWASITGDSGWAGVLAEAARGENPRVAYVIYTPGMDVLALMREAMALLPAKQRWQLTFSTYFTDLPAGLSCTWRCCVAGTNAAKEARRYATSGIVINLTKPAGTPPDSQLVQAARTGRVPTPEPTPALEPDAVAAELPIASLRSPKRSLKTEPFDEGNGAGEQNEISETPTTLAELGDSAKDQVAESTNSNSVRFWLVAILWPLLVIPAVFAFDLVYYKRSLQDQNDQLQRTISDIRQSLALRDDDDNSILRPKIEELKKSSDVSHQLRLLSDKVATTQQVAQVADAQTKIQGSISEVSGKVATTQQITDAQTKLQGSILEVSSKVATTQQITDAQTKLQGLISELGAKVATAQQFADVQTLLQGWFKDARTELAKVEDTVEATDKMVQSATQQPRR